MTARARRTDPITSNGPAATVDANRSQAAVLRLLRDYMGRYFTHRGAVDTYRRVAAQQELNSVTDCLPHLSESRMRTACSELARKRLLRHADYTEPARARRDLIWELADEPTGPVAPVLDLYPITPEN